MSNQSPEIITKYEVMFAVRTGVTVMVPLVAAFDSATKAPLSFKISPENPADIVIHTDKKPVVLKGLKKNHLEAAVSRGFIMFYETKDDEIIRSTLCNYQKN
jgi:hypothetical protein